MRRSPVRILVLCAALSLAAWLALMAVQTTVRSVVGDGPKRFYVFGRPPGPAAQWFFFAEPSPAALLSDLCLVLAAACLILAVVKRRTLHHRAAGGRCVFCGYDLRESPGRCPECGAAAHPM